MLFIDYNILYFIDEKCLMLYYLLVECICFVFEIISGNWCYDVVFCCVKIEFLYLLDVRKEVMCEEMDEFENYCLVYGV